MQRKPPEQRHNRHTKDLVLVEGEFAVTEAPPMPEHPLGWEWNKAGIDAWHAVWSSRAAGALHDGHAPGVMRYIELADQRLRLLEQVAEVGALVSGYKGEGHYVKNPLLVEVARIDKDLMALEDRFGMSLKAELNLGLSAAKTAATKGAAAARREAAEVKAQTDPRRRRA